MNEFLKAIGLLLIAALSVMLSGYAFATLWDWFIVAKFGLPSLGIAEAIGVGMVAAYVTKSFQKDERTTAESVTYGIVKPLAALGIGYIVLQFV